MTDDQQAEPEPATQPTGRGRRDLMRDDRGQTTAEYALVLVAVAVVAAAFMTWAGGSGRIADLFEAVMARLLSGV